MRKHTTRIFSALLATLLLVSMLAVNVSAAGSCRLTDFYGSTRNDGKGRIEFFESGSTVPGLREIENRGLGFI